MWLGLGALLQCNTLQVNIDAEPNFCVDSTWFTVKNDVVMWVCDKMFQPT